MSEEIGNNNEVPPLSIYHTHRQKSTGGPWQAGIDLSIGFTWDKEREIPQPVAQLHGQDVSAYARFYVDQNRCLIVDIDLTGLTDIVCTATPDMYLLCTARLSADGSSFTGQINRLCNGKVAWAWRGACIEAIAVRSDASIRWFQLRAECNSG